MSASGGRPGPDRAWAAVASIWAAEAERWLLWLPVLAGAGIGIYFALPAEPPVWIGPVVAAALSVALAAARRSMPTLVAFAALAAVAFGFAAAQVRTAAVSAPVLTRGSGPVVVTGRVVVMERGEGAARVTLDEVAIAGMEPAATPERVRLHVSERHGEVMPGMTLRVRAFLQPPPGPVMPGSFDFGRQLFFARIGAVGRSIGPVEPVDGAGSMLSSAAAERARRVLADRILDSLDGARAGVAAALVAGEQRAIPAEAMEEIRISGLAHLLSISGLHVGLVAGLVFFAVRALLAMVETVALRFPIKKWAAVPALTAAVGYTLLVGAPVPTQRAALMTGIVLGAMLLERNPFSMRLVAFAAAVVLLLQPESMLGPSFQMSFGAVIALIAAYESLGSRFAAWRAGAGMPLRAALYLFGLVLTSLVASLATLPFGLHHFQQIQFYGVAANMIAVPVTSFWVMPLGLVSVAAMPFGLESWPLEAMALGIDVILGTASVVAGLPGASGLVPAMPVWGLTALALGGLWLVLWTRRWRLLGLIPVALGFASILLAPRPDLLVSDDGRVVALRDGGGHLLLSTKRAGRFDAQTWLRHDGRADAEAWPAQGPGAGGALACDPQGCIWNAGGKRVAIAWRYEAFLEDCLAADIVVAPELYGRCAAPVAITRGDLLRKGAHALRLGTDGVRIETVADARGSRPWAPAPR
ncbi:ComEC/Rec2 family competence protein [Arenibaculum sp.]|uniref:ComEC/Rec2 family competence protein n=1 Tax=Arenibaculum sp. TaxID=2865862 RepID=UPI002E1564D7|nr:ComEC/Rec2 family competence protein [Arenibaculum sp.]